MLNDSVAATMLLLVVGANAGATNDCSLVGCCCLCGRYFAVGAYNTKGHPQFLCDDIAAQARRVVGLALWRRGAV